MGYTTTARQTVYVTVADAAARTGFPERTLRTWCVIGHLPSIQVGRAHLIAESDLADLKRPRRATPVKKKAGKKK